MKKYLLIFGFMFLLLACNKNFDPKTFEKKEFQLVNVYKEFGITLQFEEDRFYGYSGVNRYFGTYKLQGDKIILSSMGSTKMAGEPKAMKAEDAYLDLLGKVEKAQIKKGKLVLYTKDNNSLEFQMK